MLCRLYDTKNKRYIDRENLSYMVHPDGAAFCDGVEDHRIFTEPSAQRFDDDGKEMFVNDIVEASIKKTGEVVRGVVTFLTRTGTFAICQDGKPLINSNQRTRTWNSYKNIKVVGTTHDEEMEAE